MTGTNGGGVKYWPRRGVDSSERCSRDVSLIQLRVSYSVHGMSVALGWGRVYQTSYY